MLWAVETAMHSTDFQREQAEAMNRVVVMVAEGEVDKEPKGKEVEVKGEEATVAKREKAEG